MSLIRKNFLFNIVLTISSILFPIITFPYASRVLGPEGIGKVQFVVSITQYFILIAALGVPVYGIREVAKLRYKSDDLKQLFTEILALTIFMCITVYLCYLLAINIVPSFRSDKTAYLVSSLMLLFNFCNIDWFFSGLERFRFIAFRSLIVRFIALIFMFLLVKNKADDIWYLWITVATSVLNNLFNIFSARDFIDVRRLSLNGIVKHLKPLFYIFSTVAAISVYSFLDTILLGFFTNYTDVGYYTAASKINKITIPVLTSLGAVLIPQITQAFKEDNIIEVRRLANHSFDFVILLGIPMSFGLMFLAPELIDLFSGSEFSAAVLPMQIFAPVVLIIGLSNVWAIQILTPAGNDKQVTISVMIGLVSSLALNFVLIPRFSYLGAAVTNVLSELIVMLAFAYFSSFLLKPKVEVAVVMQTVCVSLLFFPVVYIFRTIFNQSSFIVCILSVFICVPLYLIFQLFVFKNQMVQTQCGFLKAKLNL